MRKFFCLLPLFFLFVACYDDSELVNRIKTLETTTVAPLKVIIATLEQKQSAIAETIVSLEKIADANKESIDDLQEDAMANQKEIDELKRKNLEISESINSLKEWVEGLFDNYYTETEINSQIDSIYDLIDEINTAIDNLDKRVGELESIIAKLTKEFSISFSYSELGVSPGSENTIEYTISGASDNTIIKLICKNGWKAEANKVSNDRGTITVTAPNPLIEDEIIVLAYDGEYRTIMSTINFVKGVITPSVTAKEISIGGASFTLDIGTNMIYKLVIPENDKSWISVANADTKAMRVDKLAINVSQNTGITRHSTLSIVSAKDTLSTIAIVQKGNEPSLEISRAVIESPYTVYTSSFTITSNVDWTISSSESWCAVSATQGSKNQDITVSIAENKTNEARTANVVVKSNSGNLTKTITISQAKPPYFHLISTQAELEAFREKANGGETDINGRLTADIALTGSWFPIGTNENRYSGVFDGNGHKITGLSMNYTKTKLYVNVAFFGYTQGATITNLTIEGSIDATSVVAGLIANAYSTTIDYCTTNVSLNGKYAGGIVSISNNTSISNCCSHGWIGSLNSYNHYKNAGGIVYENGMGSTIKNSYCDSRIETDSDAGGIACWNNGLIENCVYSGNLTSIQNAGYEGAIVGVNNGGATINYAYFLKYDPIYNRNMNAIGDIQYGKSNYLRSFDLYGNLSSWITVGPYNVGKLEVALNYWIIVNQTKEGEYREWSGRAFKE